MARLFHTVLLGLALVAAHPPSAITSEAEPDFVRARAVAVLDGDTFLLEDGRQVRLAGVEAAKALTVAAMKEAPPVVGQARETLSALVAGRVVRLQFGGVRADRHRRLLAHVYVDDAAEGYGPGVWVQGSLLRQGMARVATSTDNRRLASEMLVLEEKARADRHGIWSLEFYRVLAPEDAATRVGGFGIVEGTVWEAAIVRSRAYLNFDEDWRSDFTVSLDARARRLFRAAEVDVEALGGRRVRVRGWIRSYNGPMIEATHPEQVEVLAK